MAQGNRTAAVDAVITTLGLDVAPSLIVRPKPPHEPDFTTSLLRPDDLLTLRIEGYNLHIVTSDGASTVEPIDTKLDAFLVVTFPLRSPRTTRAPPNSPSTAKSASRWRCRLLRPGREALHSAAS